MRPRRRFLGRAGQRRRSISRTTGCHLSHKVAGAAQARALHTLYRPDGRKAGFDSRPGRSTHERRGSGARTPEPLRAVPTTYEEFDP